VIPGPTLHAAPTVLAAAVANLRWANAEQRAREYCKVQHRQEQRCASVANGRRLLAGRDADTDA
jgi:hypothetical protein